MKEKEEKEKADYLRKQRLYADELMKEMRKKKQEKDIQKSQMIKDAEQHLKKLDLEVEKQKYTELQKKRKFIEFDHRNQRKNQWYE